MTASQRPGWIACLLVASAAMLEIALGVCVLQEVSHAALGRIYVCLGIITILGLHGLFECHDGTPPTSFVGVTVEIEGQPSESK